MGLFVTFEGPEGGGKTTQIRLLSETLKQQGHDVCTTREPGGTEIGNAIRSILLDLKHKNLSPRTEVLLFNAARAQLVDEVIRPNLSEGCIVLCDRYIDSTLAYQGYGRGQELDELQKMIDFATGMLIPDLTVFLDIEVQEGLRRKQAGDEAEWNRLEAESLRFHELVRRGYLKLATQESKRWLILDATEDEYTIQQHIMHHIESHILLTRKRIK